MAIAEVFPYSNQHDLNLDWVISKIKEFSGNQISGISCEQIDANTVKFVITYTDGTTRELTDVILPEGPQGPQGETGATPNLTAGTVTTLPAGSDATVSITGTAEDPILNLGIPQGIQGQTGATGAPGGITNFDGYTGALTAGDGIAFDTTTGKISSYDFNLTDTGTATVTNPSVTNVGSFYSVLNYALNADKSIGKIYGIFNFTVNTSYAGDTQTLIWTTNLRVAPADAGYTIRAGVATPYRFDTAGSGGAVGAYIEIAADGSVAIKASIGNANKGVAYTIGLPPCIYFFKDFGDTPDANTLSMRMAALSMDPFEDQER